MIAAALLHCLLAPGAWAAPAPEEGEYEPETWQSFSMEATAIVGEVRYQDKDYSSASTHFSRSLGSSVNVRDPQAPVMALDLYRTAEFAAREKDYAKARRHLHILLCRYPDTPWAKRGKLLLAILPGSDNTQEGPEPEIPGTLADTPEMMLSRIQGAVRQDRVADALSACLSFLDKNASHSAADEVRLLCAVLSLRAGNAQQALRDLRRLIDRSSADAGVRSKALYLLTGVLYSLGDFESMRAAAARFAGSRDRWASLAQAWLGGADEIDGRRDSAASRFEALALSDIRSPVRAYALASAAACQARKGRPEALKTMRLAAEEAERFRIPDLSASARISMGHILFSQRRLVDAAQAYSEFAARYPESAMTPGAMFLRGMSLKRAGRPKEAAAAFQELLASRPDSGPAADAHLQLGQIYDDLGQPSKAVSHYQAMGRFPGRPALEKESVLLIAQVHYNGKRFKEAAARYEEFLENFPQDPRSGQVSELLLTSYWMGDHDAPQLQKALERYPRNPIGRHMRLELGRKAFSQKRFSDAASLLSGDLPAEPAQAAEAKFMLAESLAALSKKADAAAAYREVVSRFPGTPMARQASFNLGNLLFENGDFKGSESAYRGSGSGNDSMAADSLFNRGLSLQKGGDAAGALRAFESLLKRFPKHPRADWARLQAGALLESSGRVREAAEAFSKVQGEGKAEALFKLGRCRERLKSRDLARKAYEALMPVAPHSDPFRLAGLVRLGLLYEVESKPKLAEPLYREVVRLGGDGAPAKSAAGRLQAMGRPSAPRETAPARGPGFVEIGPAAPPRQPRPREPAAPAADPFDQAAALDRAGNRFEALKAYELALLRSPRHPRADQAWLRVGDLRRSFNDDEAAAAAFSKVRSEGKAEALFKLGRCREDLKRRDLAKATYRQLSSARPQQDPYRLEGLLRLASLYESDSDPDKALEVYMAVVQADRGGAAARTASARIQAIEQRAAYQK
jgi:TolA-binding protein